MNLKDRVWVGAAVGAPFALMALIPDPSRPQWRVQWQLVLLGVLAAVAVVVTVPAGAWIADRVGDALARLSRRGGGPVDVHAEQAVAAMGGDVYAEDFAPIGRGPLNPYERRQWDALARQVDPDYREASR